MMIRPGYKPAALLVLALFIAALWPLSVNANTDQRGPVATSDSGSARTNLLAPQGFDRLVASQLDADKMTPSELRSGTGALSCLQNCDASYLRGRQFCVAIVSALSPEGADPVPMSQAQLKIETKLEDCDRAARQGIKQCQRACAD